MYLLEQYAEQVFGKLTPAELARTLADVACVDLTPSSEYFYTNNDKEFWLYTDFPVLVPPWPQAWFELKVPKWSRSGDKLVDLKPHLIPRLAAYAVASEFKGSEGDDFLWTDGLLQRLQRLFPLGIPQTGEIADARRAARETAWRNDIHCRWAVLFRAFFESRHELIPGAIAGFYLDTSGKTIEGTHFVVHEATKSGFLQTAETMMLTPVFFGISLLHAKGVTTEAAPRAPERLRKARAKKGFSEVRYRTIVVHPLQAQVEREAGAGGTRLQRALHMVRGNFATYTADKPLFGRYTGVVWRPLHVRGSRDSGVIAKDYRVDEPETP